MARTEEEIVSIITKIENIDYPIAKQVSSAQYRPDTDKTDYSDMSVWFQLFE